MQEECMRKLAILGALALMAVPASATASSSTAQSDAQKQCRQERTAMGVQTFRDTYGTNKNKHKATEKTAHSNASKECKAERAADPAAFKDKYGTGKNKKNAFGKCVSQKARAKTKQEEKSQVQAEINAAKQCKDERSADPAAFKDKYGTNKNKSNAFGKCVSQKAKAQQQSS
jgi:uncharacterized protein (DUF2141 family)